VTMMMMMMMIRDVATCSFCFCSTGSEQGCRIHVPRRYIPVFSFSLLLRL
jgi:hypothetical protein